MRAVVRVYDACAGEMQAAAARPSPGCSCAGVHWLHTLMLMPLLALGKAQFRTAGIALEGFICSLRALVLGDGRKGRVQCMLSLPIHWCLSCDTTQTAMQEPVFRVNFALSLERLCTVQLYFLVVNKLIAYKNFPRNNTRHFIVCFLENP